MGCQAQDKRAKLEETLDFISDAEKKYPCNKSVEGDFTQE